MKPIKEVLSTMFKCHGARIIILAAHWSFTLIWKGLSKMLDEAQRQKLVMVGDTTCPQLTEYVAADQLLERYGGTAK